MKLKLGEDDENGDDDDDEDEEDDQEDDCDDEDGSDEISDNCKNLRKKRHNKANSPKYLGRRAKNNQFRHVRGNKTLK